MENETLTLVGVGGLAMLAAWAATPEFRSIEERGDASRRDEASVTERAMITRAVPAAHELPACPDAPSSVFGQAPAWYVTLPKRGNEYRWYHENHSTSAAANASLRQSSLASQPVVNWRARAQPNRNQGAFLEYKFRNTEITPVAVQNPF